MVEVNPFAKKSLNDGKRNPFTRKIDGDKTIHKSESFFDKVDAFEGTEQQKSTHSLDNFLHLLKLTGYSKKLR